MKPTKKVDFEAELAVIIGMVRKLISYILHNKTLISLICMIGVVAVSYGMLKDNTLIFIIGLFFVFAGYLLIRRKIKEPIRNNP